MPETDALQEAVGSFLQMEEDCTCFPICLANAATLIGRSLNGAHMVRRLEDEGVLKPGNQGVVDVAKAERALKSYLEDHGVKATFHNIMPLGDLLNHLHNPPSFPQEYGVAVAMSYAYVNQYHSVTDDLPTAHFQRIDYQGPSHDVVVLGRNGQDVLLFDPDPALDHRHQEPGWPRGVLKMDEGRFKAFYHGGEHPREATILERLRPVPAHGKEQEPQAPGRREAVLAAFDRSAEEEE